jgi:hypothetical protein
MHGSAASVEVPSFCLHWACRALELRDVQDVADDLLDAAEFAETRVANFFGSSDGRLIRGVVTWVLPYPFGGEFDLLVEAVMLAAEERARGRRRAAALLTLLPAGLLALILMSD